MPRVRRGPPRRLAPLAQVLSPCRWRHWYEANRPAPEPTGPPLYGRKGPRKHYHVRRGVGRILVGHRENVPWFGTECPPECPGLGPDEYPSPCRVSTARPRPHDMTAKESTRRSARCTDTKPLSVPPRLAGVLAQLV